MKSFFLYVLLIIAPISSMAQDVSGLYSGTLVNDSTKKIQNYELLLSEYRDKITGYSYTTFVVNDTLYYSIKRVQGRKANDQLIIEDTKMLSNNFPVSPAKGVRQINTIPLPAQDSLANLNGAWKTTQTKNYYALSGSVTMKREKDSARSQLLSHLNELNIVNANPQQNVSFEKKNTVKGKALSDEVLVSNPLPPDQRKINLSATLTVDADSLVLSFYDNGVVDGDSISVLFNKNTVISKQQLKANASKKTIYLNSHDTTGTLLLIAENLGSIPPNTGLLIVQDGDDRYQVNFSTDLQTNAAIMFRKKKKP